MGKFFIVIWLKLTAISLCNSQSQISFGLGFSKSFKSESGYSYGGQINISSPLDSLNALTIGLGYSKSNKYAEISAYSFSIGVDLYAKKVFQGFRVGPSISLGLQSPENYRLLSIGLETGYAFSLGSNAVLTPNFGVGYQAVLGYSEFNSFATGGGLSLGYIF